MTAAPSDGLVEDLARGLHADWLRSRIGDVDDGYCREAWETGAGPLSDADLNRLSFRNQARAMLAANATPEEKP